MRPALATCSLAGCFGCHVSLLDLDERLLDLFRDWELDRSPLTDKRVFDREVDVGLVEGACATEDDVRVLRELRARCRVLVAVGECALTGGVPSLRNGIPLREVARGPRGGAEEGGLPALLERVVPCHEVVPVDRFLPGCPPAPDAFWELLRAVRAGRPAELPYALRRFD